MPLTRPIPPEAMPVVEVLRRDVPRPKELPVWSVNRGALMFDVGCCPMGLHPNAVCSYPYHDGEFPDVPGKAIRLFACWWDELLASDAQAAVDAVWGEQSGN